MTLEERLEKIESLLVSLLEKERVREWYSVEEFSRIVGRAEFTCREWCRHGRISAKKKESGAVPTPRGRSATRNFCDSRGKDCFRFGGQQRDRMEPDGRSGVLKMRGLHGNIRTMAG